jgi:hypothetical protein
VVAVAVKQRSWPRVPPGAAGNGLEPAGPAAAGARQAVWWLGGAAVAVGVLAAAAAVVSWAAQYDMVAKVKRTPAVAALEAGIPDVGAVIFAALGVALALHGRRAVRPRVLNAACVGISLAMNALAARPGWRDLAIWVMPAAVYAVASDTLIGVVRAWVLARQVQDGRGLADDGPTLLAAVGGTVLWLLRLALAPPSTLAGFRAWVVRDCPVAPGRYPGHAAELDNARREAAHQLALAVSERDGAVAAAAAQVQHAREEAAQAGAAEAALRSELDQARAEARQLIAQIRDGAARECETTLGSANRQVQLLQGELQQIREDAARALAQVRDAAAAQVAAVEQARAELAVRAEQAAGHAAVLRAERDRLAAELEAARRHAPQPARAGRARPRPDPDAAGRGPTKRDQMIALAGQRRDLAALPLGEVSTLANGLAAEIGYSPGTARRELVRHVRGLQSQTVNNTPADEEAAHEEGETA